MTTRTHRSIALSLAFTAALCAQTAAAQTPATQPPATQPARAAGSGMPDHPAVQLYGQSYTPHSIVTRNMGTAADQAEQFGPYHIIGNVYYVGTKTLSSFLIVTPAGNILLDSTYERNVPVIQKSVTQLGYKFSDIKILLGNHAHGDHMEGDAAVKELTGATVEVMAEDVPMLQKIQPGGKPHPIDKIIHDGDTVSLGGTTLTAHLTGGHTPGCTTYTDTVEDKGKTYHVVFGCSLRSPAVITPEVKAQFDHSFAVVRTYPCDIMLGDHPGEWGMIEKFAKLTPGGPNPFIDAETCHKEIDIEEAMFHAILAEQAAKQQIGCPMITAASSRYRGVALSPTRAMRTISLLPIALVTLAAAQQPILQPLAATPGRAPATLHTGAAYYVPATLNTIRWGYLPAANSAPILTVPSGSVLTFDTLSHEGLLEDQGRDPVRFFGGFGVPAAQVLADGIAVTHSNLAHDFSKDGPHIVIGPVAVDGAQPGDLLRIDFLAFTPRVSYGVISNRHGKGALPGEFPETPASAADASAAHPERFHNNSQFVRLRTVNGKLICSLPTAGGHAVDFPAAPFLGTVGLAPASTGKTSSIPPNVYGGNLDIRYLTAGSTLYLPVQTAGAKLFVSDPHFAQGNGEVALTAVEGSLRATLRVTVLKFGQPGYPSARRITTPFAETPDYWIAIGLDPDLNEAMKKAVRNAVDYLSLNHHLTRAAALAYLSAATDFEVSQVVDRTKGVHALIRKRDFALPKH